MRVRLQLSGELTVGGRQIALASTLALLDGVAEERTVQGAARRLALSYRSAWGRVADLETILGRPIASKTKGHGTILTPFGEALRAALRAATDGVAEPILAEQHALEARLRQLESAATGKLRIAASHDPLLVEVLSGHSRAELTIVGSEAALDRLSRDEADLAGCHFGSEPDGNWEAETTLASRGLTFRPVFLREQGLIVRPGNPLGIRSVRDIARQKARFINRQKGSGTRAWFDRLLAEAGLSPSEIAGYAAEEFTHQAVAAVVAAGGADAGLGVRAVAEAFGLAFVPLGRETYYLALKPRPDHVRSAAEIAGALAERVSDLPGYALAPVLESSRHE